MLYIPGGMKVKFLVTRVSEQNDTGNLHPRNRKAEWKIIISLSLYICIFNCVYIYIYLYVY